MAAAPYVLEEPPTGHGPWVDELGRHLELFRDRLAQVLPGGCPRGCGDGAACWRGLVAFGCWLRQPATVQLRPAPGPALPTTPAAAAPIPTVLQAPSLEEAAVRRLWSAAAAAVAEACLEGISRVKRCSLEGRAAMSVDLQVSGGEVGLGLVDCCLPGWLSAALCRAVKAP